ncbi:MAG TPA: pitrilysin family protein [Candidatus Tyrphobacter sp.]|nr:pitrilysin family protein [Candidatus Tyrphobacter sp.]
MTYKKTTLDNGLRIITAPKEDSLTTSVFVLVEAGLIYETKEINGLSHFLEHMVFKGTPKRPRTMDIASELDSLGASYNAFTSEEFTAYWAKAEPRHFEKILDAVSDIYLNPLLAPEEINKEKGVIIEEINMYEDIPMRRVQGVFTSLLYGDQPAGWDVIGRKEVIEKIGRDDFLKYRASRYLPSKTIVVIAGKINEDEVIQKTKTVFGQMPKGVAKEREKIVERPERPGVLIKQKNSDQSHIVLGVKAFNIFDDRKYALQVLADILGGGMSSRLFQEVREKLGAAYYVRAEDDLYPDRGLVAVSAGLDNRRLAETVGVILGELKKMAALAVTDEELKRAHDHLIGNLMISLEASDHIAGFYGGEEVLTGEIKTPEEIAEKIRAVTAKDIEEVAKSIFKKDKLNLAMIGPEADEEKFLKLLEEF